MCAFLIKNVADNFFSIVEPNIEDVYTSDKFVQSKKKSNKNIFPRYHRANIHIGHCVLQIGFIVIQLCNILRFYGCKKRQFPDG